MRMVYGVLAGLVLMVATTRVSLSSCGSASCPLSLHRFLQRGMFQVSLAYEYIDQDRLYLGSSRSFIGAIPEDHDEVQTVNQRTLFTLQAGLLENLGLTVELPFVHREHSHILNDGGTPRWESWNFGGLGDVTVTGQWTALSGSSEFSPHLDFLFGVKAPTGVTHEKNAEGEEAEVTVQPGTGSTDLIIGAGFRKTVLSVPTLSGEFSALPLIADVSYRVNGRGTYGWQFGNVFLASAGTAYQFVPRASLLFQVNARVQGFAAVGLTGEPRENTGGTWIFASPGFSVQLNDTFSGYAYLQFPLYQNVHGLQQTSAFNLQMGITASTSLLD